MLDYRIYTFLKLCDTMNYRSTAEQLNMTQPAVTQHIHYLEQKYHCKLFIYNSKKLLKTKEGSMVENYARSVYYNERAMLNAISTPDKTPMRIGATKTIGDFVISKKVEELLQRKDLALSLLVDNTECLLTQMDHNELDFALIEGFFDRQKYEHKLFRKEKFIGICEKSHPFSKKAVPFSALFNERIIVREKGSGTRAILEQILLEHNYSLQDFKHQACISSFSVIKETVLKNCGISFVYESIAKSDENLGTFTIQDIEITREFNYVHLKDTKVKGLITIFEESDNDSLSPT